MFDFLFDFAFELIGELLWHLAHRSPNRNATPRIQSPGDIPNA
jgi:hypothetical protein